MATRSSAISAVANFTLRTVLLTVAEGALAVLLERGSGGSTRRNWNLPFGAPGAGEGIERAAKRIARSALNTEPAWLEQLGAFDAPRRGSGSHAVLFIAYLGLVPAGVPAPPGGSAVWFPLGKQLPVTEGEKDLIAAGLRAARERADHSPVAFRLLPRHFTLGDLQSTYEILLGRKLHKASFRRALQGAWLVEPMDEWRMEGRGRPAQLYRFSPRRGRARRALRFDLRG
jgi:8-oxo-dGTP diphosphatase